MVLGRGKQAALICIFLLFLAPVRGQAGRTFSFNTGLAQVADFTRESNGSVVINYSIPEITLSSLENDNGKFFRIFIPGHITSTDPGKPELPVFTRMITVPGNPEYRIKISEVKSIRIKPSTGRIQGLLYPAQESRVKRELKDKPHFRFDREFYNKKGFKGADTVTLEPAGKARSINLASLQISPVRYDPVSNRLNVITSMKIELVFSEPLQSSKSASGSSLYSSQLQNEVLDVSGLVPGYTEKPVGMIIVTDTAFRKQLKPFLEWKTRKGFRLNVLFKGAGMAGSTYTEIKNSINNIWKTADENNPAPDYILLIGDIDRIPYYGTGTGGQVTDMYYGEFDGSGDYIPEMYVGRIPAKDTADVRSTLAKIIQYEKFEFADTNKFYTSALATAGHDAEYATFMDGQVRYSVENYFTPANRITGSHFYFRQVDLAKQKDSIIKIINRGTGFINYSGHGDAAGWLHLNIKVADTSKLTNRNMYPVIISNACQTGRYSSANSFGNRMLLERNRGASGFIGGSNDTYWDEDYYWYVGLGPITATPVYAGKGLGAADRYFHTHGEKPAEWYYTLGQINFAGNMAVNSSTSRRKKYYWEIYSVLGDPSMIPVIGTPGKFNTVLPDTLPEAIRSFSFVTGSFAYAAISRFDTLWDASFAGASGGVTLDIPVGAKDSCLVVITGQNRYPLIKTIYFADIDKEFLNLDSTYVNDNNGNGNSKADFKESIYLSLKISNLGKTAASDAYVKLSTSSPLVNVLNDSVFIGSIAPGTTVSLTDRLGVTINNNVPDMGIAGFDIIVGSKGERKLFRKEIPVHAPDLHTLSMTVDDSIFGNGDNIADPGETFHLIFRVRNDGSSDASGIFNISSGAFGISIPDPTVSSGILKAGETTEIPVLVTLSDNILSGHYLTLSSLLTCDPFVVAKDFTIRAGKIRESFEASSFSIFPWINISNKPWLITGSSSFDGSFSARSGLITHNQSTTLKIKAFYASEDTLKFLYKVSSELNYDHFTFSVNGRETLRKSGEIPWTKYAVLVSKGLNVFEWKYAKDGSDPAVTGNSVNIDMIDFTEKNSVHYIAKDLNLARVDTPIVKNYRGEGILRVKVTNTGRDTINGFVLSYTVGNKMPVNEYFPGKVYPNGDTVAVTFKSQPDLSRLGVYNLSIYGTQNNDDYLLNDTIRIEIRNSDIRDSLRVFPNPFTNRFTIYINSKIQDRVTVRITDSKGSEVYNSVYSINPGPNSIEISDIRLLPAIYHLTIKGIKARASVPIIRLRE